MTLPEIDGRLRLYRAGTGVRVREIAIMHLC